MYKNEMDNKNHQRVSKFLSYVLRHEPQAINLQLDSDGWADIRALITGAAKEGYLLDHALIQKIVQDSDKKRFSISEDGLRIRAVQGHSTSNVNLQHKEIQPPRFLYHGTATRFLESIRRQGLISGARHHVHLSQDIPTAIAVGQRYGKPIVLKIESLRMFQQGLKFFQAENGVWLTTHVSPNFICEQM